MNIICLQNNMNKVEQNNFNKQTNTPNKALRFISTLN